MNIHTWLLVSVLWHCSGQLTDKMTFWQSFRNVCQAFWYTLKFERKGIWVHYSFITYSEHVLDMRAAWPVRVLCINSARLVYTMCKVIDQKGLQSNHTLDVQQMVTANVAQWGFKRDWCTYYTLFHDNLANCGGYSPRDSIRASERGSDTTSLQSLYRCSKCEARRNQLLSAC